METDSDQVNTLSSSASLHPNGSQSTVSVAEVGVTWDDDSSDFTKGFFLFTAILSFVGNLLVLILFLRNRKWLKKAYGRFIMELAVVDMLTAVCLFIIPVTIHIDGDRMLFPRNPVAREFYCRFLWSHYVLFALGVTSVYTCLVLTVERWVAVVKPFKLNSITPTRRSIFASLAVPCLAGFSLVANVVMDTVVVTHQDGKFSCLTVSTLGTRASSAFAVTSFLGAILLPALFIVFMYGHILVKLRQGNARNQTMQQPPLRSRAFYKLAFRRTTKMAACATVVVVICWLPCQLYILLANLGYASSETSLHKMLNLLAFFNSCLNPFIYAFSNAAYRKKFMETFAKLNCQNAAALSSADNPSVFV